MHRHVTVLYELTYLFKSYSLRSRFHSKSSIVDLALKSYRKHNKSLSDIKRIMDHKQSKLKHHNYRDKLGELPPPSRIELCVLGTGKSGTTKSVFVDMDYFKYLFNCGEGTQRIALERKIKIARCEHIFITDLSWRNIGGLTGMTLTLQDANVPFIKITGPPNVETVFEESKNFSTLSRIKVEIQTATETCFKDEAMEIDVIPIFAESCGEPDTKKMKLTEEENSKMAVQYVCKPKDKPRKIDIDKCVELEIPRNDTMKRLIAGETVKLPNGKMVSGKDILSAPEDKKCFIIVDCPNEDFIDSLLNCKINKYQNLPDNTKTAVLNECLDEEANEEEIKEEDTKTVIDIVVHFSPLEIVENVKYQEWMNRFGHETKHLLLNDLCTDIVLKRLYELQSVLNLLHPQIFPLLPAQKQQVLSNETTADGAVIAEPGMSYLLRGGKAGGEGTFKRDNCYIIDDDGEYVKEAMENDAFQMELSNLKSELEKAKDKANLDTREYPEVIFLGTGSCLPNKVRNVSAILVHLSESECMFLDCGEDCYGQLQRHYGADTDQILSKLKGVFVSHLHADHHMGLTTLLHQRKACLERLGKEPTPILLIAPSKMGSWIKNIRYDNTSLSQLLKLVPVESIIWSTDSNFEKNSKVITDHLGIEKIKACRVIHRQFPHAVRITLSNGYSLVYSGDTVPCNALVELGKGCDLLIHEATHEDDLREEAKNKHHSTTSQAINIGVKMNAAFTILTHFSQRYPKIPIFNDMFANTVGIAFDNMKVRPCDLHLLPLFTPALKALFAVELKEMKVKSDLRTLKKQQETEIWWANKEKGKKENKGNDSSTSQDVKITDEILKDVSSEKVENNHEQTNSSEDVSARKQGNKFIVTEQGEIILKSHSEQLEAEKVDDSASTSNS